MLVVTRKVGERICIGPDVVITLVRASNGSARIGIDAPGLVVSREPAEQESPE